MTGAIILGVVVDLSSEVGAVCVAGVTATVSVGVGAVIVGAVIVGAAIIGAVAFGAVANVCL